MMNLIKSISRFFSKKFGSANTELAEQEDKVSKSVALNVPGSKAKRRKQKRGY